MEENVLAPTSLALLLYTRLRAVSTRWKTLQNTKIQDNLAWIIGNGDPINEVSVLHRISHAWEQQR